MSYTNVLQYLESSARDYPERLALKDAERRIAYRELECLCKRLALAFIDLIGDSPVPDCFNKADNPFALPTGVARPVVVYIDRNIESLIAFLAVVYSGNFYVPVDASFPKDRLDAINASLKPILYIDARKRGKPIEGANILSDLMGECGASVAEDGTYTLSESVSAIADEAVLAAIREDAIDTDPLYSIFTSGTTGVPKGVLISHRSVIDLIERFGEAFDFPDIPVFGNQAPFDFDVSVKDIYNSLRLGGCVCIIPKSHFVMSAALLPYLKDNGVNVVIWAVSALRIVENFHLFDECVPTGLKLIMFSGEVMPPRTLNYIKSNLPKATYVNLYGPTEITCNCNYYIVDRDFAEDEVLPIGRSFRNSRVFLRDVETGLIIREPDTPGEICIEGTSLALGYYNNETATEKAFTQRPGVSAYRDLIYLTGDLGRYNEKGELFYLSRKDYQIKHMGHRIELGEIEAVVNGMDAIHNGCCVYLEEKELIVLFYSAAEPLDKEIRAAIRAKLPAYMMPNKIHYLEKMPMNSHDKTDRKRLLDMAKEMES